MSLHGHPSWPLAGPHPPLTLPANFALKSWELGHPQGFPAGPEQGKWVSQEPPAHASAPGPQTLVSPPPDGHKDSATHPASLAGAPPG